MRNFGEETQERGEKGRIRGQLDVRGEGSIYLGPGTSAVVTRIDEDGPGWACQLSEGDTSSSTPQHPQRHLLAAAFWTFLVKKQELFLSHQSYWHEDGQLSYIEKNLEKSGLLMKRM